MEKLNLMRNQDWRDNSAISANTVFLMRMKYSNEKIRYPAQLHAGTLGIFTNLKHAEHFLRIKEKKRFNFLEDKPFKIYEIEEIALNYFWNFIRTRFYDYTGKYYGQHIWEEDGAGFDPRFKKGDIVEFIDGTILRAGIVAGIPPDKDASPFSNYYLLLHGYKEYFCSRAASFNVFPLSGRITAKSKERLFERFKKEHANIGKLKKEIEKNQDNTTYRIIE